MYLENKSYLPVVILPCWTYSTDYGINCSRKAFYTILKIKMMLHVIHAYSVSIGCTLQNVSLYFQTIPVFLDACSLKGMQWILWYGIWEKQMMALISSWRNEGLQPGTISGKSRQTLMLQTPGKLSRSKTTQVLPMWYWIFQNYHLIQWILKFLTV